MIATNLNKHIDCVINEAFKFFKKETVDFNDLAALRHLWYCYSLVSLLRLACFKVGTNPKEVHKLLNFQN